MELQRTFDLGGGPRRITKMAETKLLAKMVNYGFSPENMTANSALF
jgi:hypothetical protein